MNYKIPYTFILNTLYPIRPTIKKRLGGYFLYNDKKLIFFLRDQENEPEYNGVFIATTQGNYTALQAEIHASKMEFDLDGSKDEWIFISEDLDDFEAKIIKACNMIKTGDERIGR